MSDLINRLRGQYQIGPNGEYGTRDFASFIPPIALEAANEIEHLNARVKELEQKNKELTAKGLLEWDFKCQLLNKIRDLPPEFSKLIDDNYWELI